MSKFFCLVEGKSIPNNPRTHTTSKSASQEALRLAKIERKTTYVVEVLETYEVEVKKTYDRVEVQPQTLKDGDEGVFTDARSGNQYKTLVIGEQEWMNENIRFMLWNGKYSTPGKWSENDEGLYSGTEDMKNGCLYQWSAAIRVAEGLPDWWRLPTKEDFKKAKLGENPKWNRTYVGCRYGDSVGTFYNRGSSEYLWSATETSDSEALDECFGSISPSSSYRSYDTKSYGLSVRLVRDIA